MDLSRSKSIADATLAFVSGCQPCTQLQLDRAQCKYFIFDIRCLLFISVVVIYIQT